MKAHSGDVKQSQRAGLPPAGKCRLLWRL